MIEFLKLYGIDVLVILAIVVFIILAIIFRKTPIVKRIIFSLVTEAEKELGSGTGQLKLAMVIEWLYPKLPSVIKFFVSEKMLLKWIEAGLAEAKKKWEENPALLQK